MEHRSSTSARHLTLFWTVCFTSYHVAMSCLSSNSAILKLLQAWWGLPLLHFPVGSTLTPSWLCFRLVSLVCGQFNSKIFVRSLFARLQSSSLLICLGHQMRTMFLRLSSVDKDLQLLLQSLGQPPSFKGTNSIEFKNERPWWLSYSAAISCLYFRVTSVLYVRRSSLMKSRLM